MSALSVFALRLAAGMTACLLLLSPTVVNPRFYRVHFLTAFGLAALAAVFAPTAGGWPMGTLLGAAMVFSLAGSVSWFLEKAPGGRTLIVLTLLSLAGALACSEASDAAVVRAPFSAILADVSSAAVLGAAITAMLMGHSYLIAPSMSLRPLLLLIAVLAAAVAMRMAVDGVWFWTAGRPTGSLDNETILLLIVRWVVGFAGVLGLTWMAWRTARIRSTQSATGILYVVVIFCFLGELTSQLLAGGASGL
jgi:hypothetical protein